MAAELRVLPYTAADKARWDLFIDSSWNGTLLHTRRYLEYHADRYADVSLLIENAQGKLIGVFPAAPDPQLPSRLVSHPGITYGGLVQAGGLKGERQVAAMALVLDHYADQGFQDLIYKAIPHLYHRAPCEDEQLALVRLGARLEEINLAAAIDLRARLPLPKGRRHALHKAQKRSIVASEDPSHLPALWKILRENLLARHDAAPTHSEAEMATLLCRFPERIHCLVGMLDGHVLGGLILFDAGTALVTQYMASTPLGRLHAVLDLLLDICIRRAEVEGKRYVSFGTSGIGSGYLNEGLHHFKCLFGAGGVAHQLFHINLSERRFSHLSAR